MARRRICRAWPPALSSRPPNDYPGQRRAVRILRTSAPRGEGASRGVARYAAHKEPSALLGGLAIVAISLFAMACTTLPPPPVRDAASATLAGQRSARDVAPARISRAATVPPALRLRPADVVDVQLATVVPVAYRGIVVDDNGLIFVPPVGDVAVGGMSVSGAAAAVTHALQSLEPAAQATLQLASPSGQSVTVLGAVNRPGKINVFGGRRLSQVVADSGGLRTISPPGRSEPVLAADLAHAVIMRDGESIEVNFERAIAGVAQEDIYIHAGDYLYLPLREESTVTVLGQVGSPKVLPYWPGARLSQVIASAGGITIGGDKRDIRLVRGSPELPVVYRADLQAVVDGEQPDVTIERGDVLFVTDHFSEDLREVLILFSVFSGLASTAILFAAVL